jgi:UrcA family protein
MRLSMIFAAGLAVASAASAHRAEILVTDAPTAQVPFGDLNLQSHAGRTALTRRIQSAAEVMCISPGVSPLDTWVPAQECYRVAVASGVAQMNEIVVAGATGRTSAGR